MTDLTVTTAINGNDYDVSIAWSTTPSLQPEFDFGTTDLLKNSYAYDVAKGRTRLYQPNNNNGYIGQKTNDGGNGSAAVRYNGGAVQLLNFLAYTDYIGSSGTVSGDADFNEWFIMPPTHYVASQLAPYQAQFVAIPDTIPANWIVEPSPNLWGERRISAFSPRPIRKLDISPIDTADIFQDLQTGKFLISPTPTNGIRLRSTLHPLPTTIYMNSSQNGFSGDAASFEYALRFSKLSEQNGAETVDSPVIGTFNSPTFTPNVWQARGTLAVTQPTVPAGCYGYRVIRQAIINGNPQGWVFDSTFTPFAYARSGFDICDPSTGNWLPSALMEMPEN